MHAVIYDAVWINSSVGLQTLARERSRLSIFIITAAPLMRVENTSSNKLLVNRLLNWALKGRARVQFSYSHSFQ